MTRDALLLLSCVLAGCGDADPGEPVAIEDVRTAEAPPAPVPVVDTVAPGFPPGSVLLAMAPGRLDATARAVTLRFPEALDEVGVVAYVLRVDGEEAARVDTTAPDPASRGLFDIVGDPRATPAGATERGRIEGVAFEAPHTFSVVALDAAGNASPPLEAGDALPPFWPEDARVDAQLDGGAAILTWPAADDDVGVTAYVVRRGDEELARLGPRARRHRVPDADRGAGPPRRAEPSDPRAEPRAGHASLTVVAEDAAGHQTSLLAPSVDVLFAQAQVEQMLLGALGGPSNGALADVLSSGAVTGSAEDVLAESSGVGVASGGGVLRERPSGGGGLGGLASAGGIAVAEPPSERVRGEARLDPAVEQSGSGVFDAAIVTRTLRSRLAVLRACYERELRSSPTLAGTVRFELTVTPQGSVTGASVTQNTTGAELLSSCITRTLSALRFSPGPEGGSVTYASALALSPAPIPPP